MPRRAAGCVIACLLAPKACSGHAISSSCSRALRPAAGSSLVGRRAPPLPLRGLASNGRADQDDDDGEDGRSPLEFRGDEDRVSGTDGKDEEDGSTAAAAFAEKSQMTGFVSDYLRRTRESRQEVEDDVEGRSSVSNDASTDPEPSVDDADEAEEYLVAVPLDSCHELGIELESVQRAVLHRCPLLVHACIAPAALRLPLLYASAAKSSTNDAAATAPSAAFSFSAGREDRLRQLRGIVRDAVQSAVYDDGRHCADNPNGVGVPAAEDDVVETHRSPPQVRRDDGRPDLEGASERDGDEEGVPPVLVAFKTLEIDGDGNQVLVTAGDAGSPGGTTLASLVGELRRRIGRLSSSPSSSSSSSAVRWTTRLPDDPARKTADDGSAAAFRPRVPFMRLPPDWGSYLDPDLEFPTSDQGGNGISPILWGQWMDDEFGGPARMREVAVYRASFAGSARRPRQLSEETKYRVPSCAVKLPEGNAELAKIEREFERYQEERLRDAEDRERRIAAGEEQERQEQESTAVAAGESAAFAEEGEVDGEVLGTPLDKYDDLFTRALDRLGSLCDDEDDDDPEPETPTYADADRGDSGTGKPNGADLARQLAASILDEGGDEALVASSGDRGDEGDEARDRMERIVESRARIRTERELLAKRRLDKPPIEENPVFARYRNGTLVPPTPGSAPGGSAAAAPVRPAAALPPFPSDEHVVGFWRVVRSPTGFAPEEGGGDPFRSDNLILRVDGTTAGGPVLDTETRQKASGGTWKLTVSNEGKGDGGSTKGSSRRTASLRIRLVIPPQKDRILVMQGKLERISLSGGVVGDDSLDSIPALAPRGGAFGVPALEERARAAAAAGAEAEGEEQGDAVVFCSGPVFLEDAVTGANRNEIGTFTLQKLFTPVDPSRYTITIPRPVRNQD